MAVSSPAALSWDRPPIKSHEIEQEVFELCHQSDGLISSGNYSQALQVLRQAAVNDPTSYSPYLHSNMAECYRELKQYPQSVKESETALRFDPNFSAALYTLSLANYDSDHFDTAALYLRRLLQTSQDSGYIQRGRDLLAQIETYGKCNLAFKELAAGRMDRARQYFSEAASHDPSPISANVHSNLAYVYRQTGNPEEAINECKKSLKYKPDNKDVFYTLAIAYQDIGQFGEAVSWLQRYASVETDSARRSHAQDMIRDLNADKDKLNDASNKLPDYLEHMVGGFPLRRWPKTSMPIKVHINDGNGVKGYRSHFPDYIRRAMDTWCAASGNKLSYKIVGSGSDADIDVYWKDDPILLEEKGRKRNKQGVARPELDDNEMMTHVKVEIDCMHSFDPTKALENGEAACVCMHEIGHSLGLDHSTNYSDIMYFSSSAKQKGIPTSRDRNTLARLYVSYPTTTQAPIKPVKTPEPIQFQPPPGFLPPKVPNADDLMPPVFLPPPLVDDSDKLSPPPFFKPPPLTPATATPLPPTFIPPPIPGGKKVNPPAKDATNKNGPKMGNSKSNLPDKKGSASKKSPQKPVPKDEPFFTPPPIN